jgi:hypothetical protein
VPWLPLHTCAYSLIFKKLEEKDFVWLFGLMSIERRDSADAQTKLIRSVVESQKRVRRWIVDCSQGKSMQQEQVQLKVYIDIGEEPTSLSSVCVCVLVQFVVCVSTKERERLYVVGKKREES